MIESLHLEYKGFDGQPASDIDFILISTDSLGVIEISN
jgi:hypothetical protein